MNGLLKFKFQNEKFPIANIFADYILFTSKKPVKDRQIFIYHNRSLQCQGLSQKINFNDQVY